MPEAATMPMLEEGKKKTRCTIAGPNLMSFKRILQLTLVFIAFGVYYAPSRFFWDKLRIFNNENSSFYMPQNTRVCFITSLSIQSIYANTKALS